MLEQNRFEVVATVGTGDQAVFAARATDPDLVILDVQSVAPWGCGWSVHTERSVGYVRRL